MSDKISKLQELIRISNDGLTKEEFLANFKIIVDFIKRLQASNKETIDSIDVKYAEVVSNLKKQSESDLEQYKVAAMNYCAMEMLKISQAVEAKLAEVKNGEDGEDADVQQVAMEASRMAQEAVKPLIPTIEAIEQDLPKLGTRIRDGLELLPDGQKLEINAVQDLRKELDELKKSIKAGSGNGQVMFAAGPGTGGRICKSYDLSDKLDGVTKVFSVPAMWRVITIVGSSFPNNARQTVDWVHDANACTITFTDQIDAAGTLAAGQTLTVIFSE